MLPRIAKLGKTSSIFRCVSISKKSVTHSLGQSVVLEMQGRVPNLQQIGTLTKNLTTSIQLESGPKPKKQGYLRHAAFF